MSSLTCREAKKPKEHHFGLFRRKKLLVPNDRESVTFWAVYLAVLGLWWGLRGPWIGKLAPLDVDELV